MAAAKKAAAKKSTGKNLVTNVHVDGEVYGPGDDVPADVAKRITNPKAWDAELAEDVAADPEPADDDDN